MAHKYNFIPQQLEDFDVAIENQKQDLQVEKQSRDADKTEESVNPRQDKSSDTDSNVNGTSTIASKTVSSKSQEQEKLEKANAINSILSKRIIRQKGIIFDKLESDIKSFLQDQLSILLGSSSERLSLSEEEVQLLKLYCSRIMEKQKSSRS